MEKENYKENLLGSSESSANNYNKGKGERKVTRILGDGAII